MHLLYYLKSTDGVQASWTYMVKSEVHLYRRVEVMRYSAPTCGYNALFLLGKQQESIDRYHRRRGVCRSCWDQWCVEVPWNDLVCRNIIQKIVRHMPRCIQVANQPCTTVHVGEAINTPCLTAAPSARVGVALRCAPRNDSASRGIVLNHVERRPCRDVVMKGGDKAVPGFGEAHRPYGYGSSWSCRRARWQFGAVYRCP